MGNLLSVKLEGRGREEGAPLLLLNEWPWNQGCLEGCIWAGQALHSVGLLSLFKKLGRMPVYYLCTQRNRLSVPEKPVPRAQLHWIPACSLPGSKVQSMAGKETLFMLFYSSCTCLLPRARLVLVAYADKVRESGP